MKYKQLYNTPQLLITYVLLFCSVLFSYAQSFEASPTNQVGNEVSYHYDYGLEAYVRDNGDGTSRVVDFNEVNSFIEVQLAEPEDQYSYTPTFYDPLHFEKGEQIEIPRVSHFHSRESVFTSNVREIVLTDKETIITLKDVKGYVHNDGHYVVTKLIYGTANIDFDFFGGFAGGLPKINKVDTLFEVDSEQPVFTPLFIPLTPQEQEIDLTIPSDVPDCHTCGPTQGPEPRPIVQNTQERETNKNRKKLTPDSHLPPAALAGATDGNKGPSGSTHGDDRNLKKATEKLVDDSIQKQKELESGAAKKQLKELASNPPAIMAVKKVHSEYRKKTADLLSKVKTSDDKVRNDIVENIKKSTSETAFDNAEQFKLSQETSKVITKSDEVDYKWENLSKEDDKSIGKSTTVLGTLEEFKNTLKQYWPQNAEEWKVIAEIITPLLVEVGLAAIPGSEIIDIIRGIDEDDYWAVTFGVAGLASTLFGGKIVKVLGKLGSQLRKSYKIIGAIGNSLDITKKVLAKGYKTIIDKAGNVIIKKGDNVISKGDEATKGLLESLEKIDC